MWQGERVRIFLLSSMPTPSFASMGALFRQASDNKLYFERNFVSHEWADHRDDMGSSLACSKARGSAGCAIDWARTLAHRTLARAEDIRLRERRFAFERRNHRVDEPVEGRARASFRW